MKEIFSILLLPWLFLGHLAPRAKAICDLILSHTVTIEGVGDVYALSTFDLNKFKHPSLKSTEEEEELTESEDENPHILRRAQSSGEIKKPEIRRIPKDLKMEKSYLAFLVSRAIGFRFGTRWETGIRTTPRWSLSYAKYMLSKKERATRRIEGKWTSGSTLKKQKLENKGSVKI